MYWLGTKKGPAGAAHVVGTGGGREPFLDSISPGKKIAHTSKYGDRFVFRTVEFGGFRAAVQVQRGTGKRVDGRTVRFPFSFTSSCSTALVASRSTSGSTAASRCRT